MPTDTSERGLEQLICVALTGGVCDPVLVSPDLEREISVAVSDAGWICGNPNDYDREYTVDLAQLLAFLIETQPDAFEGLNLSEDGPSRRPHTGRQNLNATIRSQNTWIPVTTTSTIV